MLNIFSWNEAQIVTFFFVLARLSSLVVFLPIFGDRVVPATVKILLGLSLSVVAFPLAWAQGVRVDPRVLDSSWRAVGTLACELGFGIMIGFAARWVFDAVLFAGHFVGTSIGFSMASIFDPHTESQSVALSELHYVMAAMLFLGMNGHHIYLESALQSLKVAPLANISFTAHGDGLIQYVISMSAEVIALACKLSAPVVVVVLLINLTFGIMARAVPQLNVMAVSFTANIVMGLLVVIVSLPGFVNMVSGAFDVYTPELLRFMRLFSG